MVKMMEEEYEVKLLPRLTPSRMLLCFGERVEVSGKQLQVEVGRKEIPVLLWESVGLSTHEYFDEVKSRRNWRISHYNSGRAVLRHLKDKEQAMHYMMELRKTISDWRFTEQQFQDRPDRSHIKQQIDTLQTQISGVRR